MKKISTPLTKEKVKNLKSGDDVLLSGTIYTARDQAHKRLNDLIKNEKKHQNISKNARQKAEQFDWEAVKTEWQKVLN